MEQAQVVQPLLAQEIGTMDEDREDIGRNPNYVCSPKGSSLETSDMRSSIVDGRLVPQKRHERPTPELLAPCVPVSFQSLLPTNEKL